MTLATGEPGGGNLQSAIDQWSQGDCTLGDLPILWGFAKDLPLTEPARAQAEEAEPVLGIAIAADAVEGLVVVSQTCDIIREFESRPFIQVAPIVRTDAHGLQAIRARTRPRYVFLPALADDCLVADLDCIFSVEKTFLTRWTRVQGCSDETQRRSFSETIRRYYSRPAFPDPFVKGLRGLENWISEKHDRNPPTAKKGTTPLHPGSCLKALAMILVKAEPAWEAPSFRADFFLVRRSVDDGISAETWDEFMGVCKSKTAFPATITTTWKEIPLIHLPAKLYMDSEILDLDHLSDGTRSSKPAQNG